MSVKPATHLKSVAVKEKVPQWDPHYKGKFSQYSIDAMRDDRFEFSDSRKIRELIVANKLVLELWDNPMNDGRGVLVTPTGFRVLADPAEKDPCLEKVGDFLVWPGGRGFRVWSVSIPVGIGNLAYTFRTVKATGPDGQVAFKMTNF